MFFGDVKEGLVDAIDRWRLLLLEYDRPEVVIRPHPLFWGR